MTVEAASVPAKRGTAPTGFSIPGNLSDAVVDHLYRLR